VLSDKELFNHNEKIVLPWNGCGLEGVHVHLVYKFSFKFMFVIVTVLQYTFYGVLMALYNYSDLILSRLSLYNV